ncbi:MULTISPECIES: bifunctional diguanylate cyclase/phosphodiesterase [Pseudoalteromonas]|uniref:bifunctional diguanylate cyclase/phosphodiesterase n=1 Tax=Pseudoalteromonas TaxID=53246 RepID=UPI00026C9F27|nr:EAL domain-containing protein [Pseudoalteromonas spongiae]ATC99597.1 hypothetical protein PSPO_a2688 [Pseudoalteromonas spongiae UST010723-006]
MRLFKVRSLQSKILILFLFLLLLVQLVSFYFTYHTNVKLESTQLNNRLSNASNIFETQFNNRRYYLSAFAETAAKDYGLKSVLDEDTKSFLVALNNHRKRIDSDLAMAINSEGTVFAQLVTYTNDDGIVKVRVGKGQGEPFSQPTSFLQQETAQLVFIDDLLYQLSFAPIKSGSRIVGWVGFGYLINNALANELATLTDVNIGFASFDGKHYQVIASSDEDNYPIKADVFKRIIANTEHQYLYNRIELGNTDNGYISAVLFESRADLLKSIDIQWPRLALLVFITVLLSTFGAIAIARGITRPIKSLISQVKSISKGNYDGIVNVSGSRELKQLSNEFNDMTKAIISREQTISFQAFHDQLTHLPNRNALVTAIEKRQTSKHDFLIVQLSILRAEEIAETLGYQASDYVINEVANRIENTPHDFDCYHLGNENFILLIENQNIDALIDTLQSALTMQCQFQNIHLHLQFTFGVVIASQHPNCSVAELLQKSNVAIQRAKNNKKAFQIYDPIFDQNAIERLFLTNNLRTAIEQDQLTLFFQPKLSLKTMEISHVEALVRWLHPEKGLIPPDSFISIAEKTGQMDALTRWVTNAAINQYLAWQSNGIHINIAINISAENILDKSYPDYVISLKQQHQLADCAITLEVTEDAVVDDPEKATEVLNYLNQSGFKLSIDDYGTGYSSLAQLKQLPVQELKIDRSFVQHLLDNENDQIIVKSTIELAHNMGLSVVAEGIEDEATLLFLQAQACELAQGYFISKPLPAHEFEAWLSQSNYKKQTKTHAKVLD